MRRRPRRNSSPLAQLGINAGYPTAAARATAIGCSMSHLHHCERGASLPGLDLIDRMVAVYGVPLEKVVGAAEQCCERLLDRAAEAS